MEVNFEHTFLIFPPKEDDLCNMAGVVFGQHQTSMMDMQAPQLEAQRMMGWDETQRMKEEEKEGAEGKTRQTDVEE